jgi:SAM-dependent methyltransferase
MDATTLATTDAWPVELAGRELPLRGRRVLGAGANLAFSLGGGVLSHLNAASNRRVQYDQPRPWSAAGSEQDIAYALMVADRWRTIGGLDVRGARILELGPGPDLGTGVALLAAGARSYTAADQFSLARQRSHAYERRVAARSGAPEVDLDRIGYVVTDFPQLADLDGPFDLVVSNAHLEHVVDVPGLLFRLSELLAPGGTMCHLVDPQTHMRGVRGEDPWNILRYSDAQWEAMRFPGSLNRLLVSDFVSYGDAAGFDTVEVTPTVLAQPSYLAWARRGFHRRFRSRDERDLSHLGFVWVAQLAA